MSIAHCKMFTKIVLPEGTMHNLAWSHWETDGNKMEIDVVWQVAIVTLYIEGKKGFRGLN